MDRFKTYRIFLSKGRRDASLYEDTGDNMKSYADIPNIMLNEKYEFCADILARDLNEAYKLTQNIENAWVSGENTNGVQMQFIRGARSSKLGDIFQDGESGDYYMVKPNGFEILAYPSEQSKEVKIGSE